MSDECPLLWGAAISAIARVSRGHIKAIRLAADHTGKAPQSSTQIDETRRPLSHNLCAINLPCTCCVCRTNARPHYVINCASQWLLLSIVEDGHGIFPSWCELYGSSEPVSERGDSSRLQTLSPQDSSPAGFLTRRFTDLKPCTAEPFLTRASSSTQQYQS